MALPLIVLLAACEACDRPGGGEVGDLQNAAALADGDPLKVWPAQDANKPVVLYVDRSQSMKGFLDPEYPTRVPTDYRAVLSGFEARLKPAQVFGFGNGVREEKQGGLGVLGNARFYSDGNTEMEAVLQLVEMDSALGSTHVIIGDGRRTDPNAANEQFGQMRNEAERWTAAGGTFLVAASHAPFKPVKGDASGCRGSASDAAADRETCPLYAFAFVAPGDQGRVTAALAATFENLYVTPLPAILDTGVRLAATSRQDITLEPEWETSARGAPIARVRGSVATNQPLRAQIIVADTTSPLGRGALAALRGRQLVPQVSARQLMDNPAASSWQASTGTGALLRLTDDPFAVDFITRGADAQRILYRLELRPAGEPAWLDAYDAERAGDTQRTYGLGHLFEGFSARDTRSTPPVLRLYVVVS
ncbi:MAG TPA: hypothetical protein VE871_19020 [Longimicrobium sp.]|nr:hypothetical protein [Longimicrobium sp.]